jgi:hypothetical protein
MPISLSGSLNLSGSLTTTGTITATTLVVQTITSSISSITGSTNFGSLAANTHTFTGSILITGSNYISVGTPSPIYTTTLISAYGSGSDVDIDVKNNTSAGAANLYLRSQTDGSGEIRFTRNSDNSIQGRIQFSQANGSMNFRTGGNDNKLFISSSGVVGIGTSTPTARCLTLYGTSDTNRGISFRGPAGAGGNIFLEGYDSDDNEYCNFEFVANSGNGLFVFNSATGTNPNSYTTNARMIIRSNGYVGVNNILTSTNYKLGVSGSAYINGTNNKGIFVTDNATYASIVGLNSAISAYNPLEIRASGTDYQLYLNTSGNIGIGTTGFSDTRLAITGVDSSTSNYVLTLKNGGGTNLIYVRNDGYLYSIGAWSGSDRRLKENIINLDNGLAKVLGLKARKFDFINGFKNQYGFIAQEVQEVIPNAVSVFQEEDQMLAIKMDFIIPHLVKAIQELTARVQYLENK